MSNLDLTRDWLRNVLKPYPARERLLTEVLDILGRYRGLSVKTDAFTFDDGHTALLLLIHGTLPITYRGATYHIPIHLWVPQDYPHVSPLTFVVPTKDMGVRKGREVDPGGRVREEIMNDWWRSWPDKSLDRLVNQLVAIFSAVPPVFARPPQPTSPSTNAPRSPSSPAAVPNGVAGPSQPPPPPARPSGFPAATTPDMLPQYRPAPTPPPHPYATGSPSRQSSSSYPQSMSQSPPVPERPRQPSGPPGAYQSREANASPPVPQRPYMPQAGPSHMQPAVYQPDPQIPSMHTMPQQNYQQSPIPAQYQQLQAQYQSQQYTGPMNHQYSSSYQAQYAPHVDQPAHQQQMAAHPQPQPQQLPSRQAPPDLLSSPEASTSSLPPDLPSSSSAPARPSKPPPPSQLHLHSILLPHLNATLPAIVQGLHMDKQHLLERREDLVSGEPAIRDEMARLEAVKKVCDSVGKKMDDVVAKGESRVAELEAKGEISVDEVVCGISIVHNQLIDLVAEDNAIEDTIYHMTRALDAERVDLDRFLKSIRTLAREQYMKRALIERILQGMGQSTDW